MNMTNRMYCNEVKRLIAGLLVVFTFLHTSFPAYALFGFEKKEKKQKTAEASVATPSRVIDAAPAVTDNSVEKFSAVSDSTDVSSASSVAENSTSGFRKSYTPQNVVKPVDLPTSIVPRPVETFSSSLPVTPPAAVQDAQMLQIQSQINDIIRLNETLKQRYDSQAAEIQKITEQAKIHQRILNDLESTRTAAPVENQLLNEKVRLIGQETQKNKELLSTISQISASKDAQR